MHRPSVSSPLSQKKPLHIAITPCRDNNDVMDAGSYSLNDLAEATGFEARTIRSYIERGLLPAAEARGRGASYSVEHLNRLRAIQILRRARPNIQLNEIRLFLQQMSPQQISDFCSGSLRATAAALAETIDEAEEPKALRAVGHFLKPDLEAVADSDEPARTEETKLALPPEELTGPERLLQALQKIARPSASLPAQKLDAWVRVPITDDVELAVRAELAAGQMLVFREIADLLRALLLKPDAIRPEDDE
jgi:DNA-binding transcriptional MerR regulator